MVLFCFAINRWQLSIYFLKIYIAGFTYDKMLHTMPDDAFDVIMKIHVRAPFRLVRAAAPHLRIKVRLLFNMTLI